MIKGDIDDNFWPSSDAFLDLSEVTQWSDGCAHCTGVALCDDEGHSTVRFFQGQVVHFFYEFEITKGISGLAGGVEFYDSAGRVVHGKNSFQFDTGAVVEGRSGTRLRFHQTIYLDISPGEYVFSVGLASADESSLNDYRTGKIGHQQFSQSVFEHCRVRNVGKFDVFLNPEGKLSHHGLVNLAGELNVTTAESTAYKPCSVLLHNSRKHDFPTIFHVTHWKAGSQWIHRILRECVPDSLVPPQLGETQFLHWPLQPAKIYPTVYVTKRRFDSVQLPSDWRRFVIIRDLRDTLVSAYFSIKISHPILDSVLARLRGILLELSMDDGMIYLMDEWLSGCARIQLSWLEAGEKLIRYEHILDHDINILEPLLLDECQLPVSRERFREVVMESRFERVTLGRSRGDEDISAHERKGISGDWRNYFAETVKKAFKVRYGELLIATGYEQNSNW